MKAITESIESFPSQIELPVNLPVHGLGCLTNLLKAFIGMEFANPIGFFHVW